MAQRGHGRGAAAGRVLRAAREASCRRSRLLRRHRVPMAIATDCNPGTSPLTSLLLTMNMAATLFRLTVEEAIAGVTREAARALGRRDIGTLEPGKWCDLAIWDIERPAELVYRIGFNPAPQARVARRAMTEPWLTVKRGDGALAGVVPAYRRAVSRPSASPTSLGCGSRAAMPTGASTSSMTSPRSSARPPCTLRSRARSSTSTAIRPAFRSIRGRRRPACVRPRPSTAVRSTATAPCRLPRRSSGASGSISRPITWRSRTRSSACVRSTPRVVLYDCHSIRSVIPRLFPGELPVFNIGTNDGAACDPALASAVARDLRRRASGPPWSTAASRAAGSRGTTAGPADGIHVVQMELAIRGYLPNENDDPRWDAAFAKPIQETSAARAGSVLSRSPQRRDDAHPA